MKEKHEGPKKVKKKKKRERTKKRKKKEFIYNWLNAFIPVAGPSLLPRATLPLPWRQESAG